MIAHALSAVANADIVVASNLPATQIYTGAWEEVGLIAPDYNNYNNVSKGQSFTSQLTGVLTTVDALIASGRSGEPPLNISIYTSNAGIPVTRLGTVQMASSRFARFLFSNNYRETIDFTHLKIPLVYGNEYLVAFETPFGLAGTHGGHSPYLIGWPESQALGRTASQARNGIDWEVFRTRELGIEVRGIPEPASAALLLTAMVALSTWRPPKRKNYCGTYCIPVVRRTENPG